MRGINIKKEGGNFMKPRIIWFMVAVLTIVFYILTAFSQTLQKINQEELDRLIPGLKKEYYSIKNPERKAAILNFIKKIENSRLRNEKKERPEIPFRNRQKSFMQKVPVLERKWPTSAEKQVRKLKIEYEQTGNSAILEDIVRIQTSGFKREGKITSGIPEIEPNDSMAIAMPISIGDSIDAAIDTLWEEDYFSFTGNAGQIITIETYERETSGPVNDTQLWLLDSTGTILDFNDDGGNGYYSLIENYVLDYTGTYYIKVKAYGWKTGTYGLNLRSGIIEGDIYEPNDNFITAHAMIYGDILPYATIDPSGDVDYYSFAGNAGDSVKIYIDYAGSSLDAKISLYDSLATMLIEVNEYGAQLPEVILYELPANGTYYIKVENIITGGGPDYTYLLGLQLKGYGDPHEPNNRYNYATPISYYQTLKSCVIDPPANEPFQDVDFYQFTAQANDTIVIDIDAARLIPPSSLDSKITLYDVDGTTVLVENDEDEVDPSSPAGDSRIDYVIPADGTYYIKVESYLPNQGGPLSNYNITLWKGILPVDQYEPNDNPELATAIDTTAILENALIYPQGDQDYYWFQAGNGDSIHVKISPVQAFNISISLVSGDSTIIAQGTTQVDVRLDTAGIYYLIVESPTREWGFDHNYSIQLEIYPQIPGSEDPYEPNDTLTTAYPIAYGDSLGGATINPIGDLDYYTFSGSANDYVIITVDDGNSPVDVVIYLLNSSGDTLAMEDSKIDGQEILDSLLPETGVYYILVEELLNNAGGADYSYGIKLEQGIAPLDLSPDYLFLEVGTDYQFTVTGGVSPYTFGSTNTSTGTISSEGLFTALSPGWTKIYVVDAQNDTDTSDVLVVVADTNETNNTLSEATPLIYNSYTAAIFPEWDRDFYVFTAYAGDSVHFFTSAVDSNLQMDTWIGLFNSDSTELIYNDDINYPDNRFSEIRYVIPKTGTYYLLVRGYESGDFIAKIGSYVLNFDIITGIDNINSGIPTAFSLDQNYPNPFNPSTEIRFSVAKNGKVKLVVYDILGRKVKTLFDKKITAGKYSVTWDGTNYLNQKVTSGVYFYRLETEHFVKTRKMLFLK